VYAYALAKDEPPLRLRSEVVDGERVAPIEIRRWDKALEGWPFPPWCFYRPISEPDTAYLVRRAVGDRGCRGSKTDYTLMWKPDHPKTQVRYRS
jgi:hypothetical protein